MLSFEYSPNMLSKIDELYLLSDYRDIVKFLGDCQDKKIRDGIYATVLMGDDDKMKKYMLAHADIWHKKHCPVPKYNKEIHHDAMKKFGKLANLDGNHYNKACQDVFIHDTPVNRYIRHRIPHQHATHPHNIVGVDFAHAASKITNSRYIKKKLTSSPNMDFENTRITEKDNHGIDVPKKKVGTQKDVKVNYVESDFDEFLVPKKKVELQKDIKVNYVEPVGDDGNLDPFIDSLTPNNEGDTDDVGLEELNKLLRESGLETI